MNLPIDFVDWDRLRIFIAVVKAGSFTNAGHKLELSQSAVSRQVCSLEATLKLQLFYRHARGLRLTENGEIFFEAIQAMESRLSKVLERITDERKLAEGPLRITTTVTFGSAWLAPRIAKFHQLYPDIRISVLLVDSPELDLLARQADVAIRFKKQTRGELIQQRLMSLRYHLYASKSYLAERGTPTNYADLDHHELIVYGGGHESPIENFDWVLKRGRDDHDERRPALRVNNVYGMYRAVKSGLGIAALPRYIVEDASDLQEILTHDDGPSFGAYMVYAEDMRGSKRIQAWRDFLMQEVRDENVEEKPTQVTESADVLVCLDCRHVHAPAQPCVFH
jgi:DNA-binding transcriptional LysR family regulator